MIRITEADWHPLDCRPNDLGHEKQVLGLPESWVRPRPIAVSPTHDLFDASVPLTRILRVFNAMQRAPWHTYQIITNGSHRLLKADPYLVWLPSIRVGVSVPSKELAFRIDDVRQTGAALKFVSCEPLEGPLPQLDLHGIDWLIVGGDTRPGTRPLPLEWLRDLRDQCLAAGVLFCLKHRGGRHADRVLDGRTWDEMPVSGTDKVAAASGNHPAVSGE